MTKPSMEHRHFVLIADIIAHLPADCRDDAAATFAAKLAPTNPRFDRERFIAAAMGQPSNGRDKVR